MSRASEPGPAEVALIVGTAKGAYLLRADEERAEWRLAGPWFAGRAVDAVCIDGARAGRASWPARPAPTGAPPSSAPMTWGGRGRSPRCRRSASRPTRRPRSSASGSFSRARSTSPRWCTPASRRPRCSGRRTAGRASRSCAASGTTPTGRSGSPGAAACACTRSSRTRRTATACGSPSRPAASTARTTAGGRGGRATWGIVAPFLPVDDPPEFGQCVHKVSLNPARPDTLFLQHHWGVYRSDDAGDTWVDIGEALPSDFGFPVLAHPHEPETVYVIPLVERPGPADAGRALPRLPQPRRREELGGARRGASAGRGMAHRAPRRADDRRPRPGRRVLRHPLRGGLRLDRRRGAVVARAPTPAARPLGARGAAGVTVEVRLAGPLRPYAGGAAVAHVELPADGGATVAEVLDVLERQHPGLAGRVRDETRRHPPARERLRRRRARARSAGSPRRFTPARPSRSCPRSPEAPDPGRPAGAVKDGVRPVDPCRMDSSHTLLPGDPYVRPMSSRRSGWPPCARATCSAAARSRSSTG